jgi:hypothetical protein
MSDFRWEDLDQRLLSIREQELAEEMHKLAKEETREVQQRAIESKNGAYYVPEFFKAQLRVLDKWSERLYEIYRDVWEKQGNSITPVFIRAVRDRALTDLFAVRHSAVLGDLALRSMRRKKQLNATALRDWRRKCDHLKNKWFSRLEVAALEMEHRAKKEHNALNRLPELPASSKPLARKKRAPSTKSLQTEKAKKALAVLWQEHPSASHKEMVTFAGKVNVPLPWPECRTWDNAYVEKESAVKALLAKAKNPAIQ